MTRLGHTVLQGHMTCFEHYQLGLFEIHQFVYETIYGGEISFINICKNIRNTKDINSKTRMEFYGVKLECKLR